MSNRAKSCKFDSRARIGIYERDNGHCIMCGTNNGLTYAHYISRARGGLGVEQNGVLLCIECHRLTDQSIQRKEKIAFIRAYLKGWYGENFDEEKLYYKNMKGRHDYASKITTEH